MTGSGAQLLFLVLSLLLNLRIGLACAAPDDANFERAPPFWCSLRSEIKASSACSTEVEETIQLPWAVGVLNRNIPIQQNQRLEDVSAFRIDDGAKIPLHAQLSEQTPPFNAVVNVRVLKTASPVTVVVKYKVVSGVTVYIACSGIGSFSPIPNKEGITLMMAKWAIGGNSVSEVRNVAARFVLDRDSRVRFVDSVFIAPSGFNRTSRTVNNDTSKPVEVFRGGSAGGLSPSRFLFFLRFSMQFGIESCPSIRSCVAEDVSLNETFGGNGKQKILIGLCIGVGFAIAIAGAALWVCCCKRQQAKQPDADEEGTLPTSLRHFAYDTGDETQDKKWKEWTQASPKSNKSKEEFYALDLSPRARSPKSTKSIGSC